MTDRRYSDSGRPRRAVLAFILLIAFLDIMAMSIVIPVLPELIKQMTGSSEAAGWWNGVFVALWAGMQLLSSPIIGSLSDRYGRRPVLLLSIAGLGLDFVLMALAPNLWWLAVARMISGVTSSSFTTTYAYMADITAPEDRARGFGLIGAAFSGGFIIGPAVGGLLAEISLHAPFWAAAALCGLTFVYGLFVVPESLSADKRMAFSWGRANPFGALRLLGSHADLPRLSMVNFLLYFAHHVFTVAFVLYAGDRFGWSSLEIGLLLALAGALDMAVQGVAVGPVVSRLGDRRTMILGLLGGAMALVLMGLSRTPALFIAATVLNATWGLAMPTIQSLMTRHVSESEQGQLQGANNSVASVAGVISPLVFGAVYAASSGPDALLPGIGTAFVIAGMVLALGALIGWRAGRQS